MPKSSRTICEALNVFVRLRRIRPQEPAMNLLDPLRAGVKTAHPTGSSTTCRSANAQSVGRPVAVENRSHRPSRWQRWQRVEGDDQSLGMEGRSSAAVERDLFARRGSSKREIQAGAKTVAPPHPWAGRPNRACFMGESMPQADTHRRTEGTRGEAKEARSASSSSLTPNPARPCGGKRVCSSPTDCVFRGDRPSPGSVPVPSGASRFTSS